MPRAYTTFRLTASRFSLPILVLLTGVGFVVRGPLTTALPPSGDLAAASLVVTDATGATAAHPASAISTLAALADGLVQNGPKHRLTGAGSPPCGGRDRSAPSWKAAPSSSVKARTSLAATRGCVFARDALARSGRLSAPTTAPPTSPF